MRLLATSMRRQIASLLKRRHPIRIDSFTFGSRQTLPSVSRINSWTNEGIYLLVIRASVWRYIVSTNNWNKFWSLLALSQLRIHGVVKWYRVVVLNVSFWWPDWHLSPFIGGVVANIVHNIRRVVRPYSHRGEWKSIEPLEDVLIEVGQIYAWSQWGKRKLILLGAKNVNGI